MNQPLKVEKPALFLGTILVAFQIMKYLLFTLPFLFLISCKGNAPGTPKSMSAKDSKLYMGLWLKQMKKENYREMRYGFPLNEPIPTCILFPRYTVRFKVNSKGQLMIGGDIMDSENWRIQNKLVRFLTYNMNINEAGNNFSLFQRTSLKVIETNVQQIELELERLRNSADDSFKKKRFDYKKDQLDKWKAKRNAIACLKAEELTEIHPSTSLEFECRSCEDDKFSISDSVFMAYFHIRDSLSDVHFGEPYLEIYRRYLIHKDTLDDHKLNALKVLMPIRFIDWTNANKYKHVYQERMPSPPVEMKNISLK